jgi:uncharacterized protein YutE (UPF0331/DUF86 family)
MSINLDLIRDRFHDIEQSLDRLDRIRTLPQERFLADQDTLDLTCYRLLVAIEAALQICFHVSAHRFKQIPSEYAECFGILGREGVLSAELSRSLQQMARFRNMLVHVYWRVDYDRVYTVLQDGLGDLRAFVQAIERLI